MSCDKSYSQPDPDGSKSDLTFKVLVCGDGRVGKSSLMLQYCRVGRNARGSLHVCGSASGRV